MACEQWQEAISAQIDGEEPGIDPRLVDAHLRNCADCRGFAAASERTQRVGRVMPAPEMPDLSRRVVKANAIADRAGRWGIVRAVLAVVAVEVIVFALRDLVEGSATAGHATRHLGAFSIAYGVGLLMVVARPARARTMLPVAAVLAGALFITAVIDLANGKVPLLGETGHLPELLSVILIWLLAVPAPRPRRHHAHRDMQPNLRAVSPDRTATEHRRASGG
jgi:predicted anti-sigma-YlaC factor YlaD